MNTEIIAAIIGAVAVIIAAVIGTIHYIRKRPERANKEILVIDGKSGKPVAGAQLTFIRPDKDLITKRADENGRVYLKGMEQAKYSLFVAATGYAINVREHFDLTSPAEKITLDRLPGIQPLVSEPEDPKVFLRRSMVDYKNYQDKVSRRYLVCGTSLKALQEYVLNDVIEHNINEYRIILPDFRKDTASYMQLQGYRPRPEQNYGDILKQVKEAYTILKKLLENKDQQVSEHLRLYSGIMFQNITVFDDEAFISFYDATGAGPNNITVYSNKDKDFIDRVVWLFDDMWKAGE